LAFDSHTAYRSGSRPAWLWNPTTHPDRSPSATVVTTTSAPSADSIRSFSSPPMPEMQARGHSSQNSPGNERVEAPDVGTLADLDLDVACPGPQLELGVYIQQPTRVLGRPHVDRAVWQ